MQLVHSVVLLALVGVATADSTSNPVSLIAQYVQNLQPELFSAGTHRALQELSDYSEFITSCLSAYPGMLAWYNCETPYMSSESTEDDSSNSFSAAIDIANTYSSTNITAAECATAFSTTTNPDISCAFYLQSEGASDFVADLMTSFSGVDECAYLSSIFSMFSSSSSSSTSSTTEDTEYTACDTDSSGMSEDSLGNITDTSSTIVAQSITEFNAIADRCDDIAPGVVSRPSSAPFNVPPFMLLAMSLILCVLYQ